MFREPATSSNLCPGGAFQPAGAFLLLKSPPMKLLPVGPSLSILDTAVVSLQFVAHSSGNTYDEESDGVIGTLLITTVDGKEWVVKPPYLDEVWHHFYGPEASF